MRSLKMQAVLCGLKQRIWVTLETVTVARLVPGRTPSCGISKLKVTGLTLELYYRHLSTL